ncbi:MAG: phosphoribosylformylglycinamidine synthase subunit PurS [candidate division Zixibacteria bacterium]|nr:phosphoribosylformylglycinamidine synthase subunit PurS [candidate division Zixibacteria bacterium]
MVSAKVTVVFKEGVLDPQGKTIFNALQDLGYNSVKSVSTGKVFNLDLEKDDRQDAERELNEICQKLLANPVIEDYRIEVE